MTAAVRSPIGHSHRFSGGLLAVTLQQTPRRSASKLQCNLRSTRPFVRGPLCFALVASGSQAHRRAGPQVRFLPRAPFFTRTGMRPDRRWRCAGRHRARKSRHVRPTSKPCKQAASLRTLSNGRPHRSMCTCVLPGASLVAPINPAKREIDARPSALFIGPGVKNGMRAAAHHLTASSHTTVRASGSGTGHHLSGGAISAVSFFVASVSPKRVGDTASRRLRAPPRRWFFLPS